MNLIAFFEGSVVTGTICGLIIALILIAMFFFSEGQRGDDKR